MLELVGGRSPLQVLAFRDSFVLASFPFEMQINVQAKSFSYSRLGLSR